MAATYRGVSQEQIAQTSQDALNFLKGVYLGPEHRQLLDEWLRDEPPLMVRNAINSLRAFSFGRNLNNIVMNGPLAAIRSAKNSDELLDVMKESQFCCLFKIYEPLLAFFALSRQLEHNDHKAMEIYQGLKSWDAFTSNHYIINPSIEREINAFLQREYSARWEDSLNEYNSDAAAAFKAGMNTLLEERLRKARFSSVAGEAAAPKDDTALEKTEKSLMSGAEELPSILSLLSDSPEELSLLSQEGPNTLAYAIRGMENAVLLEKHGNLLEQKSSPIQSYRAEANSERVWENLCGGITDIVRPFFLRDEFMAASIAMKDLGRKHVLNFSGTRDVAQALASAQPKLQVFDGNNQLVVPQAPGQDVSGPSPGL